MVNLPPPNNDPNVPEGDQAPAAPDRFAPQWIGEHDPNNNNGWIEWDVPLGRDVGDPMVDPKFDEEEMDDDDDDVEWLMASVTPSEGYSPGLRVPPIVIEDLSTCLGNLEYRHRVLMRKMVEVSDAEVGDSITIGEIHPRVATMEEQVQTLQMVLHGAELQNQQLRTKVAEMGSREGTMMSYMLWMEERLTVLEKRLSGPPSRP
nr:hypothetical protein [Tanacetum cinerariifolium]